MTRLMSFLPVRLDLPILQGSTFYRKFQWNDNDVPVNIFDCTFRMQIRPTVDSIRILAEYSSDEGHFEITGFAEGEFTLKVSPEETKRYQFSEGVYDLEVTFPSGDVYRIIEGKVKVSKEVTR